VGDYAYADDAEEEGNNVGIGVRELRIHRWVPNLAIARAVVSPIRTTISMRLWITSTTLRILQLTMKSLKATAVPTATASTTDIARQVSLRIMTCMSVIH
jgi:hypothetical protein